MDDRRPVTVAQRALVQRVRDSRPPPPALLARTNTTGLPDRIRSGVEALSGVSLDGVKVHTNSRRPTQLGALAYTQGRDIYLGPGQERHLAHEAWHVVQQAEGRVAPERQMKGGVAVNEDGALEREADRMGALAERTPADTTAPLRRIGGDGRVAQMVRGGLEFTEDGPAELYSLPYNALALPGPIAQEELWAIRGAQVSAFVVPGNSFDPQNGPRPQDYTLMTSGEVQLTNDVVSAEWVITRHGADVTPDAMKNNLAADLKQMFAMRSTLADNVAALARAHPGSKVLLAPGDVDRLANAPDPEGLFHYKPGTSAGKAQITIQYTSAEAIRRINLLNASKFLRGTKVGVGEDVARVTGSESDALRVADAAGTTSFSRAGGLLTDLQASSQNIVDANTGARVLTQLQVGLVKLMVLNDALAATMVRYAAQLGQAQDKNLQRFFPKSRRDEYTKAVAAAAIAPANMVLLNTEINRTAAADALLFYNEADAGALRVDEAFAALGLNDARIPGMIGARQALNASPPRAANAQSVTDVKDVVLGINGATLATWIARAADAYTDTTVNADNQWQGGAGPGGNASGNVIGSTRGFTPVAGGGVGAIYEFRERETSAEEPTLWNVWGGLKELTATLDALFRASA